MSCLTLNRTLTSVSETVQHCKADHGVDIPDLVQKHSKFSKQGLLSVLSDAWCLEIQICFHFSLGLDDYGYIKMINYIRTTVSIILTHTVQVYVIRWLDIWLSCVCFVEMSCREFATGFKWSIAMGQWWIYETSFTRWPIIADRYENHCFCLIYKDKFLLFFILRDP